MSQPAAQAVPPVNAGGDVTAAATDRALAKIYQPRPAPIVLATDAKPQLYNIVADSIGDRAIDYLEFGVYRGASIEHMSRRFRHPDSRFVGFDSFEGLPEQWKHAPRGFFSTDGAVPQSRDSRVTFVKGWFQNSLPEFIANRHPRTPTLVDFDADLYSSTLFLMTTLWHHVPEYYFVFDEFVPSEVVAMYDFARSYPIEFSFTACTLNGVGRPLQVFGHLRNTVFQIDRAI